MKIKSKRGHHVYKFLLDHNKIEKNKQVSNDIVSDVEQGHK